MALARIITHSHACSRELALDLLARGYAVEIVSPDAIPDNIADLELRVDAGPGDQLIASVKARDGERSASLEFVHHLKEPMVDFIRRQPDSSEAVYFPEQPVNFNAEPIIEEMASPADVQRPAKPISPAAEIPFGRELDPVSTSEQCARLISPPEPLRSLPAEQSSILVAEASSSAQPPALPSLIVQPPVIQSLPVQRKTIQPTPVRLAPAQPATVQASIVRPAHAARRHYPARKNWHAALTLAGIVLLAVILGFGLRKTGKGSNQVSMAVPAKKVESASIDADSHNHTGIDSRQALASSPSAVGSEGHSDSSWNESQVSKTAENSAPRGADVIAQDTVTYLDPRFKPAPKAKPSQRFVARHLISAEHHSGVVAANSVTYFNNNPPPKINQVPKPAR
jgi:hypothetical protein